MAKNSNLCNRSQVATYNCYQEILDDVINKVNNQPFTLKEATNININYTKGLHRKLINREIIESIGYLNRSDTFQYYKFNNEFLLYINNK